MLQDKIKQILELIREDKLNLPLKRDTEHYPEYIKELFLYYIEKLNELVRVNIITQEEYKIVQGFCKHILDSINEYYRGFPSVAYGNMEMGMKLLIKYVTNLNEIKDGPDYFFRMRVGSNHTFTRDEMFHIPFELRHKVSTQRYSIPGLPSLYLGSSIYICWEELNRPEVNTTQVSKFTIKEGQTLSYLNLGYPPRVFTTYVYNRLNFDRSHLELKGLMQLAKSYLFSWPLIATCSVQVKHKNEPFKPEYIIPQLLLQWVRLSTDFDGIKYFSCMSQSFVRSVHLYQNYVFPVKSADRHEGLCQILLNKFEISEAIPWEIFRLFSTSKRNKQFGTGRKGTLGLLENSIDYRSTEFALFEEYFNLNKYNLS
jgi:hypothetical protein